MSTQRQTIGKHADHLARLGSAGSQVTVAPTCLRFGSRTVPYPPGQASQLTPSNADN
jgi:hypothetical protein